jgi:hypothetical protein
VIHDVYPVDERFAVVDTGDFRYLVDRDRREAYGFFSDVEYVSTTVVAQIREWGPVFIASPESVADEVFAALDEFDLPAELRDEVPIGEPRSPRERLVDYGRRFLAWIRG